jgi:hypothetical protein
MMIIVNRVGDMITGSVNGKQFGVSFDEQKYQKMLELHDKANSVETMEELKALVEEFTPLTVESYKELVETATPYIVVNKHTNKFYLKYADKVSSKALPQIFVDKILKSVEKQIDVTPLIKCWVRFLRNPNYTDKKAKKFAEYITATYTNDQMVAELTSKEGLSNDVAKVRATTTQVAITQEGLLVCYKVSKEITKKFVKDEDADGGIKQKDRYDYEVDEFTGMKKYKEPEYVEDRVFEPACMGQGGDAFLCGEYKGHIIKVGQKISLETWDQVNTSDDQSCVKGLHCGGLRYIQGYQNDGSVTHNIFVDPMDIGAIVGLGYGNDGAMRVLRYFVHSSFAGVNKSIYHSSKYAAWTDAEYAKRVEEVVKATQMKQEELNALIDETKALSVASASSRGGQEAQTTAGVFGQ